MLFAASKCQVTITLRRQWRFKFFKMAEGWDGCSGEQWPSELKSGGHVTVTHQLSGPGQTTTQCFIKHLFVFMSVKQNLFVSVFVQKCLMMLNDVEYTTFKMFVTQMSNYLFVISFQLMFYKTLRYRLATALASFIRVFCVIIPSRSDKKR